MATLNDRQGAGGRPVLVAAMGCAGFYALSLLSYAIPAGIPAMVVAGLMFPLAWAAKTGEWHTMGFRRDRVGHAIAWGLVAGVTTALIGLTVVEQRALPENLGLELAVGVPIWFLVASPFQEFFFRGWLQSRLDQGLGRGPALAAAAAAFTLWHYCWPLNAGTSLPLMDVEGAAATFASGLVYGYSFQRTGSILTPCLGHALAGTALLCVGSASFVGAL